MSENSKGAGYGRTWMKAGGLAVFGIAALALLRFFGNVGGPTAANGRVSAAELEKVRAGLIAVEEYLNADRVGEAGRIIEALAERYPNEPTVLDHRVEVMLHRGRIADAHEVIEHRLEVSPNDAQAWFRAGVIANMLGAGHETESADRFARACMIDTTNPQFPLYLAQMRVKQHNYAEAQVQLLRTIQLDPAIHEAWGTLAEIALIENKPDLAAQHIERAKKLAPDMLKWRVVEARVLRRQNKPEEALIRLNAIPEPARRSWDVVNEIAQCWALQGEPRRAAEEHIARLNSDQAAWESAVAAGQYYLIAGDRDEAKRWLRMAQRLKPEAPEVKALADQLEK